ncbi:SOUL family heme-binding protein [Halomarina litorea]|uniref:SOUL family heme-binding protein n=1 Tax=Halomarina litorea TaxID=2961595 RepID=UPI0020C5A782|nr:heme-binding protein [Halomarina sp. BCD28]
MNRTAKWAGGIVGGTLTLWVGWGLYSIRSAERVDYESLETYGDVEVRQYPAVVLAETTAPSDGEAFRRLFDYITGANEGRAKISMTAPVRTGGQKIAMTAPVQTERTDAGVRMGFYLPGDYAPESTPVPTDPSVSLTVEAPRTLAVLPFSWYATDGRTERRERRLLDTLADEGVEWRGDPFLLRYNDPYTPPFMMRNEVAVEVDPN